MDKEKVKIALNFIADLAEEEHAFAKVGTGAEIAFRHIIRKARETIISLD